MQLIGQPQAENQLALAVARERVGHAYLFLGPAGCGKAAAARLFAAAMNCIRQPAAERSSTGWRLAPCLVCDSCRRTAEAKHPEVLEVRPDSKTGQDISIAQAREIRRSAALRPKMGRRRVYIVAQAEALNEYSANALLKTLEEPSDFVSILLCAPNPSQVLPTIRSRCQIVRFGFSPVSEIVTLLENAGTPAGIAEAIARASGGRPGTALAWARDPALLSRRSAVFDLVREALEAQGRARRHPFEGVLSLRLAEQFRGIGGGEREEDEPARPAKATHSANLDLVLSYLRDLMLLSQGAGVDLVQNPDRLDELSALAAQTDPPRILANLGSVQEAQQLLDRNVGPPLVLERMFWALICGPIPIESPFFEECVR